MGVFHDLLDDLSIFGDTKRYINELTPVIIMTKHVNNQSTEPETNTVAPDVKFELSKQPYFFKTKRYDPELSSYVEDTEHIWVWNIYKKDLLTLGVKIIKSELGGRIGHFATTAWCFLIHSDYMVVIEEAYPDV